MDNSIGTNTMDTQGQEGRNRAAVGYMLLAVVGFSLTALVVALANGRESPFLFNASIKFGYIIGQILFLLAFYRSLLFNKRVWKLVRRSLICLPILAVIIHNFEHTFYAWSTRFIDVSISAILFDTYPLFLVILTAWLFREEVRYKKNTAGVYFLLILGLAGFSFALLSQSGSLVELNGVSNYALIAGIALITLAVLTAALSAYGLRWGANLGKDLSTETDSDISPGSLELFGVMVAFLIGNVVAFFISLAIGGASNERMTSDALVLSFGGGLLALAVAEIAWRQSNLITTNLGVNALTYASPLFSLLWLFLASQVNVARIDFLLIGAGAIITANLLINFEAELRLGFKSLIISLWVCGVWVYLRPVEGALFGIQDWAVGSAEAYFSVLTLAATVFTLILSFRVGRLVSRTRDEEDKTFALFQKLDTLVERGILSAEVRKHMLVIDVSERRLNSLRSAYASTRKCISDAKANSDDDAHKSQLGEAEAELNALVHSKQQGIVFGELAALYIVAIITVFIALSSRPALASDWNNFLVEAFAVLLSSVIIFLIFNAHDLQNERVSGILKKIKNGGYGVMFRDAQIRAFEQWLSIAISVVLAVGFGALLLDKWQIWNWLAGVN